MADQNTSARADYEVMQAREIAGVHRAVGEIIALTPAQAKYYLPPHGAGLAPVANAAVPEGAARARRASAKAAPGTAPDTDAGD